MAKISPVSIKYMIYANFIAEGALEKPDVIGAIFGQTEGLLGEDLEMRDLQKEGKIGRIEVDLERENKKTTGLIRIPTALDKSETTLIAAAVETIERIGPSDAQIEIEKIEDIRGSKRDYIIERAKKLMREVHGSIESKEISNKIKDYSRSEVSEYGKEKLPYGNISEKELIVVEGRADVINLMKNGIKNVIAMNGTNLPDAIKELSEEKDLTLFVDGDRGGKLIARNVVDNVKVKYIAIAPDGKEVEELMGKEVWANLRKKVSVDEFFRKKGFLG
ncbi:MAG TPA: DNA primase, partial [Ignavibacteria bacterium]|nr:DNA primase [Ignavibacteria bacterium]